MDGYMYICMQVHIVRGLPDCLSAFFDDAGLRRVCVCVCASIVTFLFFRDDDDSVILGFVESISSMSSSWFSSTSASFPSSSSLSPFSSCSSSSASWPPPIYVDSRFRPTTSY
jgi:hypothetical protein